MTREGVTDGKTIAQPLGRSGVFPKLMVDLVHIGEQTGDVPAALDNLADTYDNELNTSLRVVTTLIEPILIVVIVLGAIFGGYATPTEAAAIGVFGAMVATGVNRQLSWAVIRDASVATLKLTALIMWILFAAHAFSTAYTALGAQSLIQDMMNLVPGGRWGSLVFMLAVLFILGMVLDPVGIMLITLPVFLPVVQSYGFDPIWFGILFIIMMEVGYMTPPFGFNLFYLKGVAPPDVTMGDIYASVTPYVIVTLIGVLLIILIPEIATYLPKYFYG